MPRRIGFLVALCATGCAQIAGLGDFADGVEGTATGGSGASGGGAATCVPAPPSEWQGPIALRVSTSDGSLVCDGGWTEQTIAGVGSPGGDVSCQPCTCGEASGAACPPSADLERHLNASCTNLQQQVTATTTCQDSAVNNGYHTGFQPEALPGSCPPQGGGIDIEPPAFGEYALLCQAPTSVCEGGVALAPLDTPGDWGLCIYQSGELTACPAGSPYSEGPLLITNYDDTRGCTACTCQAPSGMACEPYTTTIHPQPGCSGTPFDLVHGQGCSLDLHYMGSYRLTGIPDVSDEGTCQVGPGGEPTGAVNEIAKLSVCCLPAQ